MSYLLSTYEYEVCYFSVILSLSNGFKSESEFQSEFKSEFQKVRFLGFLVIYLKDYEYLNTYLCKT